MLFKILLFVGIFVFFVYEIVSLVRTIKEKKLKKSHVDVNEPLVEDDPEDLTSVNVMKED